MTQVAIFNPATTAIIGFLNKKGETIQRTIEGALFVGGAALNAIKDEAFVSAVKKAEIGRYRSAAEIIGAGYPSVYKAVENVVGTPWANKSTMLSLLQAAERQIMRQHQDDKKFTKKHLAAKVMLGQLRAIDSLAQSGALVIENEVDTPAAE